MPNTSESKRLDAHTLWFIVEDLKGQAKALSGAADIGLLSEEDATPRIEVLRAMSRHYEKMWSAAVDMEEAAARMQPTAKRPRDFMSQAVSFALDARSGSQSADEILKRILQTPAALALLPRAPSKANVAETLSAGSRGSNPRYLRVKQGLYKNNPNYKRPK